MLSSHQTDGKTLLIDEYEIIYFQNIELNNEAYRKLAINRQKILGQGSYGDVYRAYPVNVTTGEINKSKKLAVKIFKDTRHINENEARFFNAHYGGSEMITHGLDKYMVMLHIPGQNIINIGRKSTHLNDEINQFNFSQRADLVYNIMLTMNNIHHNTPNTGQALIHGDINGSNIKVNYDKETKKIDVYVIDFGLSEEIEDEPDKVQKAEMTGTALHMSNEIIEHEVHGIKTDIYALTPIFAFIFGATNPFALKTQLRYYNPAYYKTPYDFSGMFTTFDMPDYHCDLKEYIHKFLNRMQHTIINERPDSDETLRFFTSLQKLCKTYDVDPSHVDVEVCAAKLAILADGLWKAGEFNSDLNSPIVSPGTTPNQIRIPAPEAFNFDDPSLFAISKTIVSLAHRKPLDSPLLRRIMSGDRGILTKTKGTFFTSDDIAEIKQLESTEKAELSTKEQLGQ